MLTGVPTGHSRSDRFGTSTPSSAPAQLSGTYRHARDCTDEGLAGAHGAGRSGPGRRSVSTGAMARNHPDGPLGLDPLDRRHPQPIDRATPDCRGPRQTHLRRASPLLPRPQSTDDRRRVAGKLRQAAGALAAAVLGAIVAGRTPGNDRSLAAGAVMVEAPAEAEIDLSLETIDKRRAVRKKPSVRGASESFRRKWTPGVSQGARPVEASEGGGFCPTRPRRP